MEAIDHEEPREQVEVVYVDAMEDKINHLVNKDNKIKDLERDVNQKEDQILELKRDMSRKQDELMIQITKLQIDTTRESLIRMTNNFLWDKVI